MFQPQEEPLESEHRDLKTIIIVEDDEASGEVIKLILSEEPGYYPLVVSSAEAALQVVHAVKPHLFLIDYHLAKMDGVSLSTLLHAQDGFKTVPIVIMSASLEQHAQELQAQQLRGLRKPFELEELLEIVQEAFS